jgi:hypothetical protein
LHGVGDAGKQPAQFDGGRQFAAAIEGSTNQGIVIFGDDERPTTMARSSPPAPIPA